MENMENKKIDIEMANMVGKTYFKIATWFNQDFETDKQRQEALKHVSAEIIQTVLEDTFMQIDGLGGTETKTVTNESESPIKNNQNTTLTEEQMKVKPMFSPTEDPILKALRENK